MTHGDISAGVGEAVVATNRLSVEIHVGISNKKGIFI